MKPRRLGIALSMVFQVRGGIPRFNQMLCRAIDELAPELGLEVEVFSLLDTPEDYLRASPGWASIRFVPWPSQKMFALRLVAWSALHRPAGLIVGLLGMTPAALPCRPFLRKGYVAIAHGAEAWEEKRALRRLATRRAVRAWSVSKFTGDRLVESTGIAADRIRLLPNTVERVFDPAGSGTLPPERAEFLVVARLWADENLKGVDHTIEAFARMAGDHPDWSLRIVGKGTDKPRLQGLAEATGVGERIHFEEDLGDRELAERYAACSVFVLPSGQEGFGIVFLEAMNFSKPCIGGEAGGTPEVVLEGKTGLLVRPGDIAGIEGALRMLARDGALRERLGRAGRERVLAEYTFPAFRARVASHLQDWLDG